MRSFLAARVTAENAKWFTLAAACFALFMALLDNLVVNVALPTLSRDLNASTTQLQWIVSAYILVFAALQITVGGVGDRLGRKRWFMYGIALFTATSVLAAFSRNAEMLIVFRALQGLGAAMIMPLSLSIISNAFPPEERGRAIGIWSAVSVSGLAFGPVIGGLLVQYASWHWIFLVNVPIGIGALLVTSAVVTESKDTSGQVATDIPGTVTVTGAIGALVFGLIEAGERGWGDPLILASFAVSAVFMAAFIFVESRAEKPMVPLSFFRSRAFTGANLDSFAVAFLISGIAFFGTLFLQNVHGFSPVRAGMALLPMVTVMMIASPISGSLVNRLGPARLISTGMIISGIGVLLFMRANVDGSYIDLLPSYLVMGFGNALIFAPMTTTVLNSVESSRSGVASAVNGAIREVGFAFGIAFLGTLMNRSYQSHFDGTAQVQQLRADEASAPLHPVIDTIGSGMAYGGQVDRFPGLPDAVASALQSASSDAFMVGMDRAIIVSASAIFTMSIISYFLLRKPSPVVAAAQVEEPERVDVYQEAIAD